MTKNELEKWLKLDYIKPEDIPNIDLYMDQVTTFINEQLANTKRFDEDKILTKTMINNYSKNDLLPPSTKKKYSKNHLILLIYIYYMKSFLSISDIKAVLNPLTEEFYENDKDVNFTDIYASVFQMEQDQKQLIMDSVFAVYEKALDSFSGLSRESEKDTLQQFAFITMLGYDIYARKMLIEKLIDDFHDPSENKK